jgi:hypothetical protein
LGLIEVVIPEWLSPLLLQSENNKKPGVSKAAALNRHTEGQKKHQAENKLQLTTS